MGPCVRDEGLLVERLDGDLVVFDVDAQRAHQLCGPAVGVWERCDGARSVAEIAAELGVEVDLVKRAVTEFAAEGLLVEESGAIGLVDRRRLLIGAAAVSVPLMVSVGVFPASAAASTFFPQITGSPFTAGSGPRSVAFSPGGGLLAVADGGNPNNGSGGGVYLFTVGTGSPATLSPLEGSPLNPGTHASSVAFSSGGLLAVANSANDNVSVYTVSTDSPPALAPLGASPLAVGGQPESVAFSPGGGLLAVANFGDGTMTVFTISVADPPTLSLLGGSPFTTDTQPQSVAFSPDGRLLAVACLGGGVSMFLFTPGRPPTLAPLAGSPLTAGSRPDGVAFSPGGGLLAVANYGDATVSVFTVSSTTPPTLSPLAGSPFSVIAEPISVAFSPSGGLLAVANLRASVTVFDNNTGM